MDADKKSRVLFTVANSSWTFLVVAIAATLTAVGLWVLGWSDSWAYVAYGAIAGAAVGGVRDSRVFQIMVGVSGIVLLGFALWWADAGGMPAEALPLLGMALISFGTISILTRVWGRTRRVAEPTLADLDAAVTHPRMG